MVITPAMIQYHTEQTERVRGQGLADPLMTIDASNRYGLAAASLVKYYGSDQHGQGAGEIPLSGIRKNQPAGRTAKEGLHTNGRSGRLRRRTGEKRVRLDRGKPGKIR